MTLAADTLCVHGDNMEGVQAIRETSTASLPRFGKEAAAYAEGSEDPGIEP